MLAGDGSGRDTSARQREGPSVGHPWGVCGGRAGPLSSLLNLGLPQKHRVCCQQAVRPAIVRFFI